MTKLQTRVVLLAAALCVGTTAFAQARPAAPAAPQPARAPARAAMRVMTLTASAFTDGGMMPARHAQTGRDVSPALSWSGAPDSTRSFVLLMHDADAAIGDGTDDLLHWMVWNIPGTATSLPEGVPLKEGDGVGGERGVVGEDGGASEGFEVVHGCAEADCASDVGGAGFHGMQLRYF